MNTDGTPPTLPIYHISLLRHHTAIRSFIPGRREVNGEYNRCFRRNNFGHWARDCRVRWQGNIKYGGQTRHIYGVAGQGVISEKR